MMNPTSERFCGHHIFVSLVTPHTATTYTLLLSTLMEPSIAPIAWDADQQALTWALLNELEKYENFKVLLDELVMILKPLCIFPG